MRTSPAAGGLEIRRQNFSDAIYFYAPGLKRYETEEWTPRSREGFVPVSLTGRECVLQCDHCEGQLLQSMWPVGEHGLFARCEDLSRRGARGILLTGGSDRRGMVPLLPFMQEIRRIKAELPLEVVVHTGLVDEEVASGMAGAGLDGAMIDIIGSDETIREVCHLSASVGDYEASLARLVWWGIPTIPHIVLGLHYGRFMGEEEALRMVSRYPIAALVLVVITPGISAPMEKIRPPDLEEVAHFFQMARSLFPRVPVMLGCARPMGEYKRLTDQAAIEAGFNGIAYPAQGTVRYAKKKGLSPRFSEDCCSMVYKEVEGFPRD